MKQPQDLYRPPVIGWTFEIAKVLLGSAVFVVGDVLMLNGPPNFMDVLCWLFFGVGALVYLIKESHGMRAREVAIGAWVLLLVVTGFVLFKAALPSDPVLGAAS